MTLAFIFGIFVRIFEHSIWRSHMAFMLLGFVFLSFLIGAYLELYALFAPWTFASLIFTLSLSTLTTKRAPLIQRLAFVAAGLVGSFVLWLLVNLALLIPGPGRALIAWIAPLFLVAAWTFISAIWFVNLFFSSLEKEGLHLKIMHIKNAPLIFFKHFGWALSPMIFFSLTAVWARHINSGTFGEMGPLFELVALAPFLASIALGALFFIEMRASLQEVS